MDAIRPWLYIGKYRETLNLPLLKAHSIQAMLQFAEPVEHGGITSLFLPVEDVAPIPTEFIQQGVSFVREQKREQKKILVACGAGINRSTAFVVAVLKEEEGLDLLTAYQEVKRKHPEAMPHQPVWESLCHYYAEDVSWLKLIHD